MDEKLRNFVQHRVVELEYRKVPEEILSTSRISITVDDGVKRRLELCAHRLEMKRSELISAIVENCVRAVEEELGIKTPNEDYSAYVMGDDNPENPFIKEMLSSKYFREGE